MLEGLNTPKEASKLRLFNVVIMQLKFIYLCKARKKNSSKSCSRHNTLKVKTFLKKLSKPQTKLLFSLNQSIPLQFEENKFNSTYIVHTLHGSRSPSPEPEPGARARSRKKLYQKKESKVYLAKTVSGKIPVSSTHRSRW